MVVPTEARLLREFVGDGGRWGLGASYVVQPEPRGLAHALGCARAAIADDERFLMYLGDDLLDRGVVADFVADFAEGDADASLVVKPVPDPRAFGVVALEDGRVRRLVEKPQDPPSDLAIVGVYGFGPAIWEALDGLQPSARGELEITDAIDRLVRAGQHVTCHVTEGFWADAGSPTALLAANRYFLDLLERRIDGEVDGGSTIEGEVCIEAGARVRRSRIVGPALIGADCVIEIAHRSARRTAECVVAATDVIGSIIDEAVASSVRACTTRSGPNAHPRTRDATARAVAGRRQLRHRPAGAGDHPARARPGRAVRALLRLPADRDLEDRSIAAAPGVARGGAGSR